MTGLCECGCGQPTAVPRKSDARYGWVRGQPKRFVHGHNNGWLAIKNAALAAEVDDLALENEALRAELGRGTETDGIRFTAKGTP